MTTVKHLYEISPSTQHIHVYYLSFDKYVYTASNKYLVIYSMRVKHRTAEYIFY